MKFVCLFVCFVSHVEIFQTIVPLVALLIPLESPLMNRDASHNVSIYNGKVIKYGTIFSLKIHLNFLKIKKKRNLSMLLTLLESP